MAYKKVQKYSTLGRFQNLCQPLYSHTASETRRGSLLTAFDLLLIGLSVIVLAAGLKRRSSTWRIGKPEGRVGHVVPLLKYLIGHAKILRELWPGTTHHLLFWGFVVTLILSLLSQFGLNLPLILAGSLSFIQDLAGIAMLAGTLFFFLRRVGNRGLGKPERSLLPLFILLAILLTGFLTERGRLTIIRTEPF
jgi:hypothetical protein